MSVTPSAALAPPPLQDRSRAAGAADRVESLRALSVEFEAVFLAQMLEHAGLGRSTPGFDGGPGEAAFASLMVEQQAQAMAERGGLGLAEHVFAALMRREGLSDE